VEDVGCSPRARIVSYSGTPRAGTNEEQGGKAQ
jgi:hypothetical protein